MCKYASNALRMSHEILRSSVLERFSRACTIFGVATKAIVGFGFFDVCFSMVIL